MTGVIHNILCSRWILGAYYTVWLMGFYFSKITIINFTVHSFARQTFQLCPAYYPCVVLCSVDISQCVEVFPILQRIFCWSEISRLGNARVPLFYIALLPLSFDYCIFHSLWLGMKYVYRARLSVGHSGHSAQGLHKSFSCKKSQLTQMRTLL
jgi:hypothetical protein